MIAKIITGQGFAGLVDYANNIKEKDTNILASSGVSLSSNEAMCASFKLQAKANPKVRNFVGHIAFSFSPEDTPRLTDRFMAEVIDAYMRRMGIVNTQYVVFRHHDQPHGHAHIIYNRVDNDGKAITGDNNFRKSARITQALTREYGLTWGKGKKNVRRERLKGKDKIRYAMFDAITSALRLHSSWNALSDALRARGIRTEFVDDKSGKIRGVTFTMNGCRMSGSKIDRSLSYAAINKQMFALDRWSIPHATNTEFKVKDETPRVDNALGNGRITSFSSGKPEAISNDTYNAPSLSTANDPSETPLYDAGTGSSGGGADASGIGAAIAEVVLQPHVAQVSGSGGGGSSRSDDDEKNKERNGYKFKRKR